MTNTKLIWHITMYCVIAHFAMGYAWAREPVKPKIDFHREKLTTIPVVLLDDGYALYDSKQSKPVILLKDGFVLYDSKQSVREVMLRLYGGM